MRISSILFGSLFVMFLLWFWLCGRLFRLLAAKHPVKYAEMGRPTVILNNNISNNIAFMRFLFRREYLSLEDREITTLVRFLWVVLFAYIAIFVLMFCVGKEATLT